MLQLSSITKSFHGTEVLKGIDLTINQGEIFGLIGLSGAGKSTALRTINLLERPTTGKVLLNNEDLMAKSENDLRKSRQKIGMIFQHFNLLTNKTVADNVAFPLKLAGWNKNDIDARVKECLTTVGLFEKAGSYPNQLSGGQKQRVAIARGIANHPELLLADEPTSALDPITKIEVINYLQKINKELGITIIIATHDMSIVKRLCNRVALMKDGLVHEKLDVLNSEIHPTTEFGKTFLEIA
ncbi:methionine ABC transporter ATP-binding protein [Peredibacter starrii]|uniref:Cell division ATP-binding protein FtsE n=1 Tax=Peredibacter starrii TaxID=28202 RepID=A0AAX4HJ98_9BACT|nr:ATP-binding cassette domain-containing protein [Peredibacter starrii]WPU63301.1 ATP-binding cassette domain-containing protein [Peredibacter starrii]